MLLLDLTNQAGRTDLELDFWLQALGSVASGNQLDEPAVWRLLQALAKRAGLPLRGPHGTKGGAITHALAKKDARPDKVQRWADHTDFRTTQRYNRGKELFDDSPGYGIAADVAGALAHDAG